MEEKRCEWCGTTSPADAERCGLCRIAFTISVPPPQDWSHLTGNIPVVTAPLLEEPPPAEPFAGEPAAEPVAEVVDVPEVQTPQHLVAQEVVQQAAPPLDVPGLRPEAVTVPDWRAPDDPTLDVFRDKLAERDRRERTPRRRGGIRRFMVWTIGLTLIVAVALLAPARLPGL